MFTHFFIDRPIFSTVISLVIVLLGAVMITRLPVAQYPEITPPTIMIMCTYPGANAEDVVNAVAIPIEQQVNGVDHMIYISTGCSSDGTMSMTVTFEVGTDPDIATVLVQNRVKMAEPTLPEEVRRLGVNVIKRSTNMVMFLSIVEAGAFEHQELEDTSVWSMVVDTFTHFFKSHKEEPQEVDHQAQKELIDMDKALEEQGVPKEERTRLYMTNYANIFVKEPIARIEGVGDVVIFAREDFSMRIWLNPELMSARGVSVQEVNAVIQEQNTQFAPGRVGSTPTPVGQDTNVTLVTLGRLEDVSQFENMIIRTDESGGILRLKDIARIELGQNSYLVQSTLNGKKATAIAIMQRPGANSLNVATGVLKEMERQRPSLNHAGLDYHMTYDATAYTRESVREVVKTLLEAIMFVAGTVFIFLQDWRASLIPILTIPISLIGTFFLMFLFGFTINTLTLFGLILVIGIVVDDSIIVVENTQRIMDEEHSDPKTATKKSMIQVSSPVIATAMVLMAVFLPTAAMTGVSGQLYKQFALTIAGAVGISGVCALTICPALCGILLRPSVPKERKFFFFRIFNFFFDGFCEIYLFIMKRAVHFGLVCLILWVVLCFALLEGFKRTPSGFIPSEDQGVVMLDVRLPEGASSERTAKVVDKVNEVIQTRANIINSVVLMNGYSMMDGGTSANCAFGIITLKPWSERHELKDQVAALEGYFMQELGKIPEARCMAFSPPPIMGIGNADGIEMKLLDTRDTGALNLASTTNDLIGKLPQGTPDSLFKMAYSTFDPSSPRIKLDIDRDKVKKMGLSLTEVNAALSGYVSETYVNDFNAFGRVFQVKVQAEGAFRNDIEKVLDLRFKNQYGEMVPLRSFCTASDTIGPQILNRYNLFPSTTVNASMNHGFSTGQGMEFLENAVADLPEGWQYAWSGMSYQEIESGNQAGAIFALSIAFSFLFLAALYESWSSPVIIMMAVPLGVMGALLAVIIRQMDVNIYTQIGLIVMVGLSAKNAILIVEFARELRLDHGHSIKQAAYEAGRLRLRPIFMTSMAFVLGVIPLAIASGAGAAGRRAIGTAVCGGLFNETMIGIFVTPILFVLLQGLSEGFSKVMQSFVHQGRDDTVGIIDYDHLEDKSQHSSDEQKP